MKWIGTQTIYDHVRLVKGITLDSVSVTTIQSSGESFADNDTSLMTSAAIDDRINTAVTAEDLDLTADSGTAAVDLNSQALAVTGGTNITTSATGQAVTINVDDSFLKNNADDTTSGTITAAGLIIDGDKNVTPGLTSSNLHVDTTTYTDTVTSSSATAASFSTISFEGGTLAATNASVTTTDAATLYVRNAPAAGTNQTITNAYALWVDSGNARFDGSYSQTTGDMTLYDATNDGNPTISIGSSATERLQITAEYESGAQGLDAIRFKTYTAGSSANDGLSLIHI